MEFVKYTKATILTGEQVYQKVYYQELMAVLTLSISYLVGLLTVDLVRSLIARLVDANDRLYPVVLGVIVIFIVSISVNLFTYQKVNTQKEELLKSVE
jgi:Na+/proline symporter